MISQPAIHLAAHFFAPARGENTPRRWGRTQSLKCNANIPSDLAEAKLNSSNDYCSSLFIPTPPTPQPPSRALIKEKTCRCRRAIPRWCYHVLKGGVVFPAFSVLYSCRPAEPEPDGRVAFHRRAVQSKHLPGNGPGPFCRDKTQACSVRYRHKWFLCSIGYGCCTLRLSGRVGEAVLGFRLGYVGCCVG